MIRIPATATLLVILASPAGAAARENSRSADLTVRVADTRAPEGSTSRRHSKKPG